MALRRKRFPTRTTGANVTILKAMSLACGVTVLMTAGSLRAQIEIGTWETQPPPETPGTLTPPCGPVIGAYLFAIHH